MAISNANWNKSSPDSEWVKSQISNLSAQLQSGRISPHDFDGPVKSLSKFGWLESEPGHELLDTLKVAALASTTDLDEFETLVNLNSAVPGLFSRLEINRVRDAYSDYVQLFPEASTVAGPDALRDDATQMANISALLGVDTADEEEKLKDLAYEIESDRESDRDDHEDRRMVAKENIGCSNHELDSVFRTL
jgi:hypothetical protein